jgi:hypothetical protein
MGGAHDRDAQDVPEIARALGERLVSTERTDASLSSTRVLLALYPCLDISPVKDRDG